MNTSAAGAISDPVVYEVNLDLDAAIRDDYLAWLDAHIAEMVALPGFSDAQMFEVTDPAAAPGRASLCVQYRLAGQVDLERYLAQHAPRLRAEGMALFGGRFTASRRVLARLC